MDVLCNDNRFEIIEKAKKHLLEATNIDTSPDEMKVLDNFLFRCWQMGWLDRYDEQTEPQTMLNDGTLVINVEDATKVGRVLVGDDKNRGDLYYPDDEDEPQTDCPWGKCE